MAVLEEGQMLDFLGFIATAALMVLAVNAVITFMDAAAAMVVCSDCAGAILADPTRDHLGRASSLAKP